MNLLELARSALPDPTPATDPGERCRRWALHFADRAPQEVIFSDDLTHAEALALYPAAVAADPIPDTPSRPATKAEAAELRALLRVILPGDPEGQAEALQIALPDVDAAMTCYRALAADRAPHTR